MPGPCPRSAAAAVTVVTVLAVIGVAAGRSTATGRSTAASRPAGATRPLSASASATATARCSPAGGAYHAAWAPGAASTPGETAVSFTVAPVVDARLDADGYPMAVATNARNRPERGEIIAVRRGGQWVQASARVRREVLRSGWTGPWAHPFTWHEPCQG